MKKCYLSTEKMFLPNYIYKSKFWHIMDKQVDCSIFRKLCQVAKERDTRVNQYKNEERLENSDDDQQNCIAIHDVYHSSIVSNGILKWLISTRKCFRYHTKSLIYYNQIYDIKDMKRKWSDSFSDVFVLTLTVYKDDGVWKFLAILFKVLNVYIWENN